MGTICLCSIGSIVGHTGNRELPVCKSGAGKPGEKLAVGVILKLTNKKSRKIFVEGHHSRFDIVRHSVLDIERRTRDVECRITKWSAVIS